VPDLNGKSWIEVCQACGFTSGVSPVAPQVGGRREQRPVWMLAAMYWFRGLIAATDSLRAYEVGRKLEPHLITKVEGGVHQHANNWSKYATGKSLPSEARLAQVEALVPGSSVAYKHELWSLLASVVTGKPPSINKLVLRVESLTKLSLRPEVVRRNRPLAEFRNLTKLLPNCEPLTALFIALAGMCYSSRGGDDIGFNQWQIVMYAALLMHTPHLHERKIYVSVVDLIDIVLAHLAQECRTRYSFDAKHLFKRSEWIAAMLPMSELTEGDYHRRLALFTGQCLLGNHGQYVSVCLWPRLIAVDPTDAGAQALVEAEERLQFRWLKAIVSTK
jgi:hypothetical protein